VYCSTQSELNLTNSYKCTPQELAILLPAFNKIATAFDAVESPQDVGFKSSVLNDIIHVLPKLRGPMTNLMEAVSLKNAAEGRKDIMWIDSDRYPKIADADMVSVNQLY
jgi:DNA mismatch repair protein MSH3